MTDSYLAIDLGMTNIDIVQERDQEKRRTMLANQHQAVMDQLRQALSEVSYQLDFNTVIGVTGGRYRDLPEEVDGYRIRKVDEMVALGMGGLALSHRDSGLVVSAGTGAAMVSAQGDKIEHVTGSAVGGGTLLGLSRLILGTDDIAEIDRLAMKGDAAEVDIMLSEAVGGKVGRLPANANAVNLGKLDRGNDFSRENLAAGLVRLVAQVIAVIAINASNAAGLKDIIIVGHLADLESIRNEINLVGQFYHREFTIPDNPGFGTASGVLEGLKRECE
ncbi:MAG: Fumble domain-containing protein [Brevefilum sp.]|jgi:type II pantothenate kinase